MLVLVSAFLSTVGFVKVAKPVDKSNRKMRQVWKSWLLCQSEKSRATPEIFVTTEVIRQLAALIWQLRAAVFCSIAEQWSNNARESNCILLSSCTVFCSTTEHWSNRASRRIANQRLMNYCVLWANFVHARTQVAGGGTVGGGTICSEKASHHLSMYI